MSGLKDSGCSWFIWWSFMSFVLVFLWCFWISQGRIANCYCIFSAPMRWNTGFELQQSRHTFLSLATSSMQLRYTYHLYTYMHVCFGQNIHRTQVLNIAKTKCNIYNSPSPITSITVHPQIRSFGWRFPTGTQTACDPCFPISDFGHGALQQVRLLELRPRPWVDNKK